MAGPAWAAPALPLGHPGQAGYGRASLGHPGPPGPKPPRRGRLWPGQPGPLGPSPWATQVPCEDDAATWLSPARLLGTLLELALLVLDVEACNVLRGQAKLDKLKHSWEPRMAHRQGPACGQPGDPSCASASPALPGRARHCRPRRPAQAMQVRARCPGGERD